MTGTFASLRAQHKDCFLLAGGDKNDLDLQQLLSVAPSLHMLNTKPTYGQKNIDVMVTDMAHLYAESVIIPNVPTDIPDGQPGGGKASDHPIVYCHPKTSSSSAPAKVCTIKKTRRICQEKMNKVGRWLQQEQWDCVREAGSASGMASEFARTMEQKLDEIC